MASSKGSGGGLDNAAKIKAGVSIAAIVVAMLFLAWHFGLFGGDQVAAEAAAAPEVQLTPEEAEELEEHRQEQLEWMEDEGITPAGA